MSNISGISNSSGSLVNKIRLGMKRGCRIGEASHPGPQMQFDNSEADPFDELEEELNSHMMMSQHGWDEEPPIEGDQCPHVVCTTQQQERRVICLDECIPHSGDTDADRMTTDEGKPAMDEKANSIVANDYDGYYICFEEFREIIDRLSHSIRRGHSETEVLETEGKLRKKTRELTKCHAQYYLKKTEKADDTDSETDGKDKSKKNKKAEGNTKYIEVNQ